MGVRGNHLRQNEYAMRRSSNGGPTPIQDPLAFITLSYLARDKRGISTMIARKRVSSTRAPIGSRVLGENCQQLHGPVSAKVLMLARELHAYLANGSATASAPSAGRSFATDRARA